MPGLCPAVLPAQRQPAADGPAGFGQDVPIRLHRPGGQRPGLQRGVRHGGAHLLPDGGGEVPARRFRRRQGGCAALSAMRPADRGRSGHGDGHQLCPERPVPDRQRAADGKALHHHQHQSGPRPDRQAILRPDHVPAGGGVRDPALLRRGYPAAEAGAAVI